MRSLICMSLFGLSVMSMYVSAEPVPADLCCTLKSERCQDVPPTSWFTEVDPPVSTNNDPFPSGTVSCATVEADPIETDPDVSRQRRCGKAKIFFSENTITCPGDANSKTGAKLSSSTSVCKEYSRCEWVVANKTCKTIDGFPKYYKTQYSVSIPTCGAVKGGGGEN